jgi:hypothetical protein
MQAPENTYMPAKIQIILQARSNKKNICPQNPFFRLTPSRIESSFYNFYPAPFFVQHLVASTDDLVHLNENEFRTVNPWTTLNPDTLNPWTTLNPAALNP